MPELEPKHIDFENDRLVLIAEPVVEKTVEAVAALTATDNASELQSPASEAE